MVSDNAGTMLVGGVSDLVQPEFGQRSIAVGIAATGLFSVLASFLFWRVMRRVAVPHPKPTAPLTAAVTA